ncbi:hypothetical protein HPB50_018868 [Hyalomma asiaticum]|uniref:Uncharacterized protein n=1 Tax=Hyalomma asiaticum TaxID=266040 RepID=A0ACB7S0N2_HYAAI|nr:hypothetical protein HPB50_018868 [Hyalomma asiaticum]
MNTTGSNTLEEEGGPMTGEGPLRKIVRRAAYGVVSYVQEKNVGATPSGHTTPAAPTVSPQQPRDEGLHFLFCTRRAPSRTPVLQTGERLGVVAAE